MNYLLAKPEDLARAGYDTATTRRATDGRYILPMNAVKVLANVPVEIVSEERAAELSADMEETAPENTPQENVPQKEYENREGGDV